MSIPPGTSRAHPEDPLFDAHVHRELAAFMSGEAQIAENADVFSIERPLNVQTTHRKMPENRFPFP